MDNRYQYFHGQWFDCNKEEYDRINSDIGYTETRVLEPLMNGKLQFSEKEFEEISFSDRKNYKLIHQTKIYGIWADGYYSSGVETVRVVYREN